ncbi:DUF1513 domain-containing protein [Pelagibius sp. Alg239-R121]|uniref:DUF1513 domain-containing protein n=1 Tax=Pelagibius sp. Alg239-R121 TaxID=2993448 RepID=UPI0024A6AAC9|nr:DUF1513 domain-containing protein [Pelagibius sp. Alg239-R121]
MKGLSRRRALGLLGGAVLTSANAPIPVSSASKFERGKRFLTARSRSGGGHGGAILSENGDLLAEFDLPARGHGAAWRPNSSEAVIFARRPGSFAVVLDVMTGQPQTVLSVPADRHFYGHGCFSADGRILFATENDFDGERGVIGRYDATDGYRRLGEIPSHGIGPHEITLMPDRRTLLVANGGILTHPDAPRMKLNLIEMRPSVAVIDAETGALLKSYEPPSELHQLSLRHLDVRGDGRIVAVAQWEGAKLEQPPLVAVIDRDDGLRLKSAPCEVAAGMRNYCGAVAFSAGGGRFAVSSPRGGLVTLWGGDGDYLSAIKLDDGCGLAANGKGFILTSGSGIVTASNRSEEKHHPGIAFDNHLCPLQA